MLLPLTIEVLYTHELHTQTGGGGGLKFLLAGSPVHLLRFYIVGWPVLLSPEELGNDVVSVRACDCPTTRLLSVESSLPACFTYGLLLRIGAELVQEHCPDWFNCSRDDYSHKKADRPYAQDLCRMGRRR